MEKKKRSRKKGVLELNDNDLEMLNIYKQAYKRSYEDARLHEQALGKRDERK